MKIRLAILLFIFISFMSLDVSSNNENHSSSLSILVITSYQFDELDTLRLINVSSENLVFLLGQASILEKDSSSIENMVKSKIIYDIISIYLRDMFSQDRFDINDKNIKFVINFLKLKKFHLNLNPPSDFDKFLHYLDSKKYSHIWSRFIGKRFHFYTIIFILVIIVSIIIYYKFKN